jgi:3-deoxy-D-manno-octulosonic-acid transferase
MAIKTVSERLTETFAITTTTNTGFNYAKKLVKRPRFLPYEIFLPFWVSEHKTLVVLEAELWYMLFWMAKMKGMKTVLLNARISDRSINSYRRFRFFYQRLFQSVDTVFAQTEVDRNRLIELGANDVRVVGNIKLAATPEVSVHYTKPNVRLITAASTHEGEEALILESWEPSMGKLVIVPRHPERFERVAALLEAKRLRYGRWSREQNFDHPVTLIDTMGELINIYAISDTVILGGSFVSVGGHNPIEPAYFSLPIISGPDYFNQHDTYAAVANITIVEKEKLSQSLSDTLPPTYIDNKIDLEAIVREIEH